LITFLIFLCVVKPGQCAFLIKPMSQEVDLLHILEIGGTVDLATLDSCFSKSLPSDPSGVPTLFGSAILAVSKAVTHDMFKSVLAYAKAIFSGVSQPSAASLVCDEAYSCVSKLKSKQDADLQDLARLQRRTSLLTGESGVFPVAQVIDQQRDRAPPVATRPRFSRSMYQQMKGRDREIKQLIEWLTMERSRVLLHGAQGSGKSLLACSALFCLFSHSYFNFNHFYRIRASSTAGQYSIHE
jgi:hypothetical protein